MKALALLLLAFLSLDLTAQTNKELLAMEPRDFFAQSIIMQEIDMNNPNHHLLTIATFQATNLLRQKLNKNSFQPDHLLYGASELHANQMISKGFFDHINPYSRKYKTPSKRVVHQGGKFKLVAENLAIIHLFKSKKEGRYQYNNVAGIMKFYDMSGKELKFMTYEEFGKSLVEDWYQSESHRKNLINNDLTHLGLAVRIVKNKRQLGELPIAYAVQNLGAK